MTQDPLAQYSMNDNQGFLLTDFMRRTALEDITQDMSIFEETFSYFTQYLKNLSEKSLV